MTTRLHFKQGSRELMNGIGAIFLFVAAGYCALLIGLYLTQDRLLYLPELPSRSLAGSPRDIGLDYESVYFQTADGLQLHGWYIPSRSLRGVLLFFHGNAGNISHRLDSLEIFSSLGLTTFILDYRGYGQSEGKSSEAGTYADAEAAWRYLTEVKGVPEREIVVFGRSLGAAIAAYTAQRYNPAALIMESAFTSVPDLAAGLYPVFPVRWLSQFRYDNKEYIASVACPVLLIHSAEDEIIPYEHGKELYALAPAPKRFLELRGGHNDGFLVSGSAYVEGLSDFLHQHVPTG